MIANYIARMSQSRAWQKCRENKGLNTIELAILSMVILIVISGMTDLNGILRKFSVLTTTSNYITRTVGRQGGLSTTMPSGFYELPSRKYRTSSQIYTAVKDNMAVAGIDTNDFTVRVNNVVITPTTGMSNVIDYGGNIKVEVEINYSWPFINQFTGEEKVFTKKTTRTINSSYKIRG